MNRKAQWAYRLRTIKALGVKSDDVLCSRKPKKGLNIVFIWSFC